MGTPRETPESVMSGGVRSKYCSRTMLTSPSWVGPPRAEGGLLLAGLVKMLLSTVGVTAFWAKAKVGRTKRQKTAAIDFVNECMRFIPRFGFDYLELN